MVVLHLRLTTSRSAGIFSKGILFYLFLLFLFVPGFVFSPLHLPLNIVRLAIVCVSVK